MAYMNQEKKAKIASLVKPVLKKYGMKGTLSVRNHSSICLTLTEGKLDLLDGTDHYQINPYHCVRWAKEEGKTKIAKFYEEVLAALYGADYYDNTDAQIDYFDTAYYVDINAGKWNKPYKVVA